MIERALNDAQLEAALITGCLKSFAIYRLRSGYGQYRPPTLMIAPVSAYFWHTATSYWEIPIKTRAWLDIWSPGWRTQSGDPQYMYAGDLFQNQRKIGFTPTPDTSGSNYTAAMDTNLVMATSGGMTTTGNIVGTVKGTHNTECDDTAARTLANLGVKVGQIVLNHTDGSLGQISAVATTKLTATLTGGTLNVWTALDEFVVLTGDWGVYIYDAEEKYIFTKDMTGLKEAKTLINMVYLEFIRRPILLDFATQYPELPPELHTYLPEGAIWYLKRSAPRGSDDFQEAQAAYQIFTTAMRLGYVNLDSIAQDSPVMRFHL